MSIGARSRFVASFICVVSQPRCPKSSALFSRTSLERYKPALCGTMGRKPPREYSEGKKRLWNST